MSWMYCWKVIQQQQVALTEGGNGIATALFVGSSYGQKIVLEGTGF
jgi:hypothetical protein